MGRMKKSPEVRKLVDRIHRLMADMLEEDLDLEVVEQQLGLLMSRLQRLDPLEHALVQGEMLVVFGRLEEVMLEPQEREEKVAVVREVFQSLLEELADLDRPLTPREKRLAALAHGTLGVLALSWAYDVNAMLEHVQHLHALTEDIRFRFLEEGELLLEILHVVLHFFLSFRDEEMVVPLIVRMVEVMNRLHTRFPEEDWTIWDLKWVWYAARLARDRGELDTAVRSLKAARLLAEWVIVQLDEESDPEWAAHKVHWAMRNLTELAMVYGEKGDEKVLSWTEKVRSWLEEAEGFLDSEDREMFRARLDAARGVYFAEAGDEEKAEQSLGQAIRVFRKLLKKEYAGFPGFLAEVGEILRRMALITEKRDPGRALRYARECARVVEEEVEMDPVAIHLYAWAHAFRAARFEKQGQTRKALKEVEEALQHLLPGVVQQEIRDDAVEALVDLYEALSGTTGREIPLDLQEMLKAFRTLQEG